jgi:hypothetical protein
MAFDFPANPTLGQNYTAHGCSFNWNGYGWRQGAPTDPGDTILTGDTVMETVPLGSLVGILSSINVTGTPAYALLKDQSGLFAVVGDRVETVGDLAAPDIILSDDIVAENVPIGWLVGTLRCTNITGTPVYTLTDASGKFSVAGDQLLTAGTLDFDMAATYQITVSVAGVTPTIVDKVFTISVTDVVGEVADIMLDNNTVPENSTIGTLVGVFSLLNATGTPVYTLVDSAGGLFQIVGDELQVAGPLDFEAP